MKRIFLGNKDFERYYTRSRALGHKGVKIDNSVQMTSQISIETQGTDLYIKEVPSTEDDDEAYTFMCQEFGLVDYDEDVKVAISFCDNGWMLVTLLQGGIVLYIDGNALMPSVGSVSSKRIVQDDILWVNEDMLLGYAPYFGDEYKEKYPYDTEFVFLLNGHNVNKMMSFRLRHLSDESIDLSLGLIAGIMQADIEKKETTAKQKEMQKTLSILEEQNKQYVNAASQSVEYDFDDEDDDEEE